MERLSRRCHDLRSKNKMQMSAQFIRRATVAMVAVAVIILAIVLLKLSSGPSANATPPAATPASNAVSSEATVILEPTQTNAIKIEPVGACLFSLEKEAVGNIAFVDDVSVQIFPPKVN